MEYNVYLICAIVGCTLVVLQVVLQVLGFFGDMDMDAGDTDVDADGGLDADAHEGHGNVFFGILSFKALCAFAGIFGLVGLSLHGGTTSMQARILIAFAAGVAGMVVVAWMMRGLSRLQASGTLDLRYAIGRSGTVYLEIPARNEGEGKVTIEIQGREMVLAANTDGDAIPSGRRITVAAVEGDRTLKVVPV